MYALWSAAGTATTTLRAAAQAVGLAKSITTPSTPKRIWLDPISTMVALAILSFKPEGTKLHFHDRRVGYNAPGALQGTARQFVYRASSDELYNLVTAIFYANLWLKPHQNPKHAILFTRAQSAINTLIEKTYEDDPSVQLALTTAHKRLLAKALKGKTIRQQDFLVPDLSEHPVTQACKDYWLSDDSPLSIINKRLTEAQDKYGSRKDVEQELTEIEQFLEPMHRKVQEEFQRLETGAGTAAKS